MPQGIQVFNPDGSLQFDTTSRLFRTLFEVSSGTTDGSVTGVPIETGTVAITVVETNGKVTPNVSVAGGTLSWNFDDVPLVDRASAKILVEVF